MVAEDPLLLARHQFANVPGHCGLFCSSRPDLRFEGASFLGGFVNFEVSARAVAREKIRFPTETRAPANAHLRPRDEPNADFQVTARLVEVYATVTDNRGRYFDGLDCSDFTVRDNGRPVPIGAFESNVGGVSVALLLDTSGSMTSALPALKKSAFALIENLRPADLATVYSFSGTVSKLQSWTADKDAAKRAILRVRTDEATELHNALVLVIHELARKVGKKAIVVFTDGHDTTSELTAEVVVRRAKEKGIPIYTIAHGEALQNSLLLRTLATVALATGGLSFAIRKSAEIEATFERISQDLAHGYLFAFRPGTDREPAWHSLEVVVGDGRGRKVRAREGYYSE